MFGFGKRKRAEQLSRELLVALDEELGEPRLVSRGFTLPAWMSVLLVQLLRKAGTYAIPIAIEFLLKQANGLPSSEMKEKLIELLNAAKQIFAT